MLLNQDCLPQQPTSHSLNDSLIIIFDPSTLEHGWTPGQEALPILKQSVRTTPCNVLQLYQWPTTSTRTHVSVTNPLVSHLAVDWADCIVRHLFIEPSPGRRW